MRVVDLKINTKRGFTFLEIIIGTAIFVIFAAGIYQAYAVLYTSINSSHAKTLATDLANEEFEIIKNLPYASVGTVGGTPLGVIPISQTLIRDNVTFVVAANIRNIDDSFDGVAPTDSFPADYKSVEFSVSCATCRNFSPIVITGLVAPKNLESN